ETPTQTVEQGCRVGAAQTLADRPDVQFDDLLSERAVEAQRQGWRPRGTRPVDHQRRSTQPLPNAQPPRRDKVQRRMVRSGSSHATHIRTYLAKTRFGCSPHHDEAGDFAARHAVAEPSVLMAR